MTFPACRGARSAPKARCLPKDLAHALNLLHPSHMLSLPCTPARPRCAGELRKASSAVSTSTWASLVNVNDLVHEMFPHVAPTRSPEGEAAPPGQVLPPLKDAFNDYGFWRSAPALITEPEPGPDQATGGERLATPEAAEGPCSVQGSGHPDT